MDMKIPLTDAIEDIGSCGGGGGGVVGDENNENHTKKLSSSLSIISKSSMDAVSRRLASRKTLFKKRRCMSDLSFVLALFGILLSMIDTELFIGGLYERQGKLHPISTILKSIITISTMCLLTAILFYHRFDCKLYLLDNSIDHWSLALTPKRVIRIVIEMMICLIHPIPGDYQMIWKNAYNPTTISTTTMAGDNNKIVPVDLIISLFMFLRIYLIGRFLLMRSTVFQDASAQSLGALNKINFNSVFIFKSLTNMYPEWVLTILTVSLFLWASWAMRICENHSGINNDIFNSMWLIAITFLTVGYGDITPATYCGRTVAVMTGMFGAGCTALIVAVLARKLELSRAEKYVQDFVMDVEINKQKQHCAANILKESWRIFKYSRNRNDPDRVRRHQRCLMKNIYQMKSLKEEQQAMEETSVNLLDVYRLQKQFVNKLDQLTLQIEAIRNDSNNKSPAAAAAASSAVGGFN